HGIAGCGLDCWPADHYRGDGGRETQEGDTDACHARWRHGWHGLLIDAEPVLPGRGLGRLLGPSFLTRPSQTMSRVAPSSVSRKVLASVRLRVRRCRKLGKCR